MTKKPLLFVTGFLGTGKTTLMRELIVEMKSRGYRADVILNDFANAEIDAATLDGSAASIAPIAASCACCESLDELVDLCRTAAAGEGDFLLIELNGTADPLSLLEAFTLLENKIQFFPRMQVCTIDARRWGLRGEFEALEQRQLETAAFWRPTHLEEVNHNICERVFSEVAELNPQATKVSMQQLADKIEQELVEKPHREVEELNGKNNSDARRDGIHLLSHRFSGVQVPLPGKIKRRSIERVFEALPPWVLRAKALVKLEEDPGSRWLFERSGVELCEPIEVSELNRIPASLLCIGARLDPKEIHEVVRLQFGEF